MQRILALRGYKNTRRIVGRRSLTPMRGKKKRILKTRCCSRVGKSDVPILQQANALFNEEGKEEGQNKHCQHPKWEGCQNCLVKRRWQNTEEHTQTIQEGDCTDSKESLHPGTVCPVRELPESTDASGESDAQTEIEAEQLTP